MKQFYAPYVFLYSYTNIAISFLCCTVLAARFSNHTNFECSPKRDGVSYIYTINAKDIFVERAKCQTFRHCEIRLHLNKGVCTSRTQLLTMSLSFCNTGRDTVGEFYLTTGHHAEDLIYSYVGFYLKSIGRMLNPNKNIIVLIGRTICKENVHKVCLFHAIKHLEISVLQLPVCEGMGIIFQAKCFCQYVVGLHNKTCWYLSLLQMSVGWNGVPERGLPFSIHRSGLVLLF